MNPFRNLLVLILLSNGISSFSQTTTPDQDEKATIEVVGNAEKEIIPDEIYIAITIREREKGKDKVTIDQQETNLKEALQSIGVSLENLSLSGSNANYVPIKWSKKDVLRKTEYILKVSDALMVGKVFEKLDELKITEARIARVSHSKIDDYKKEVRIMAIKAAKEKADYLLKAIGQETGNALKVNEQNQPARTDNSNMNIRGGRSNTTYYYEDGVKSYRIESDKIIQFEKIKLQSAIYVKFEIK